MSEYDGFHRLFGLVIATENALEEERDAVRHDYWSLAEKYREAVSARNELTEKVATLREELERQIATLEYELKGKAKIVEFHDEHCAQSLAKAMTPPDPEEVWQACNLQKRFRDYRVNQITGEIHLSHDLDFYPCRTIVIPLGTLRVRDERGQYVDVTQNYEYKRLSYSDMGLGRKIVPNEYHIQKIRVLFGTKCEDGFWVGTPRIARDVILEITTDMRQDRQYYKGSLEEGRVNEKELQALAEWRRKFDGIVREAPNRTMIFDLIISFEEFMNSGEIECSERQIKAVREKCYTEFLDRYYH